MINGLFNSGAAPVLSRLVQFTERRQRLLANNVANLDTPFYKPRDVDPKRFQVQLRDAVDRRRRAGVNPHAGPLELRDTDAVTFDHGRVELHPRATNRNILFHDRNNRDLERTMQDLAENTLVHNTAVKFLQSEFNTLRIAIRERL